MNIEYGRENRLRQGEQVRKGATPPLLRKRQ
jgi:hypothetical protein